jgi:hypothetical protein
MSAQSDHLPRRIQVDPRNVPEAFQALIPFVEKWGISDDGDLDEAVEAASLNELTELVKAVSELQAEGFDEWLGNPGTTDPSKEWIAFISLINAYDLAKLRLQSEDE